MHGSYRHVISLLCYCVYIQTQLTMSNCYIYSIVFDKPYMTWRRHGCIYMLPYCITIVFKERERESYILL